MFSRRKGASSASSLLESDPVCSVVTIQQVKGHLHAVRPCVVQDKCIRWTDVQGCAVAL